MIRAELNSFNARQTLAVGEKSYTYFSLEAAAKERSSLYCEPAVRPEGPTGELAAPRGRPNCY